MKKIKLDEKILSTPSTNINFISKENPIIKHSDLEIKL